jgi:outer membrane protein TolC
MYIAAMPSGRGLRGKSVLNTQVWVRMLVIATWIIPEFVFAVGKSTAPETFELTLGKAETQAVFASNRLKSFDSEWMAANNQKDAQFQKLLPKLTFQANYQYYGTIPDISLIGGGPTIPFGTHSTYSIGPSLGYTLWDGFSDRKTYQSASILYQAREEDRKAALIQLLLSVRSSYIQVRLGLEELRLIYNSLELARAQEQDILIRFRAGAASRLDKVTAQRSVLNYELQFKQKQSELSSEFEDLLAILGNSELKDISRPGPPEVPGLSVTLQLDSLRGLLKEESFKPISAPDESQPQIRSQVLQSESLYQAADSQSAKQFGSLQVSAGVSWIRPNIPNPPTYLQETVGVTYFLPLFLGDPNRYLAAQQRNQGDSVQFRANQTRIDLQRDFIKAQETLASLRDRQSLAAQDVAQSEEAAKLYYTSYQAGRINLIDVQNANLQALQAKVNAARVDAQILNQLILLQAISGKESYRGSIEKQT